MHQSSPTTTASHAIGTPGYTASRANHDLSGSPATGSCPQESPFRAAQSREKRLKLFLWGDSGVGKTTLALQFPRPVVIDLEGGTDLYGESFEFDVRRASTADEVREAVQWLLTRPNEYRTLVVDPITVYWDALQKKWSDIFLRRNTRSKGHRFEFYDLQPKDWMTIKSEFKEIVRDLIAVDMNVIVTARQKVQYADGAFMRAIGETFDGEKSLPYLFDTIVRLHRDENGRFLGQCLKDRSNSLPAGLFECSYSAFEKAFGRAALARDPRPPARATERQQEVIAKLIARLEVSPEKLAARLPAYGAQTIAELTEQQASALLIKLEDALDQRITNNTNA